MYCQNKTDIKNKLIYVAMSGGVDSSVAAALLKNLPASRQGRGFDVVGVFMKPWSSDHEIWNMKYRTKNDSPYSIVHNPCLWQKDREDAMKVAAKLGIPLLTWDFSREYKEEVADYMIREYKAGRTPNPDVMCNKHIKFGLFLKKALKEGADFIATGHYVRIKNVKIKMQNDKSKFKIIYKLLKAKDKNKDQSYFLWTLTQDQLRHCLFPIGDYVKPEVRKMAKKFGLPTADKKDSQGVCFIGPLDMKEFLKKYIKPKRGKIILLDVAHSTRSARSGRVVGQHDGVFYYTIGQRHGLDIKDGKGPYFVFQKDVKNNVLYVGSNYELDSRTLKVADLNWVNDGLKLPARIDVKIRYRSKSVPVVIKKGDSAYTLQATRYKLHAITPGQSAVFYKRDELIGGGVIK